MPRLDRSPLEEIANRVAQGAVGLKVAAQALGVEDHRRMLRDHAKRVADSHQLGMKVLGQGTPEGGPTVSNEEDMGNIIVTGDITFSDGANRPKLPWETDAKPAASPTAAQPATPASQPQPTTATPPKAGLSNLAKGAIVAGLIATGLGGAGATYVLTRPDAVAPDRPDKNWGLNLLPPDPRKAP